MTYIGSPVHRRKLSPMPMIPAECLDRIDAEHKSKMDAARVSTMRLMDRIAELENAIAQHKLRQWGGDGVEVSNEADAALYAHVKL